MFDIRDSDGKIAGRPYEKHEFVLPMQEGRRTFVFFREAYSPIPEPPRDRLAHLRIPYKSPMDDVD